MKSISFQLILIPLAILLLSSKASATEKLITIYDKDCGYSQDLLNITYEDIIVKAQLSNLEHHIFEADSEEGKDYIEKFKIVAYPTQIRINDENTIMFSGFLNDDEQLKFLSNSQKFQLGFINSSLSIKNQETLILPERYHRRVCGEINSAFNSAQDTFKKYLETLQKIIDRVNLDVNKDSLLSFAYYNLKFITCDNINTVRVRDSNTILKWAIDSGNYEFIRSVLFIKENGINVCNPYVNFEEIEMINSKEETLIDFINQILNDSRMSGSRHFGTLRNIRMRIEGCLD